MTKKRERMTEREYQETVRYHGFHLIVYPMLIILGIYIVGELIETTMNINTGVAKTIFMGIGGTAYFVYYFKAKLYKRQ